jgi:hypothetical protein
MERLSATSSRVTLVTAFCAIFHEGPESKSLRAFATKLFVISPDALTAFPVFLDAIIILKILSTFEYYKCICDAAACRALSREAKLHFFNLVSQEVFLKCCDKKMVFSLK